MTHHQPKGSMCMSCSNGSAACAQLPFGAMPIIQAYPDGVKAVKCSGHQPTRAERDRPAALRASEEARAVWWLAQQPVPPRRCSAAARKHSRTSKKAKALPAGANSSTLPEIGSKSSAQLLDCSEKISIFKTTMIPLSIYIL